MAGKPRKAGKNPSSTSSPLVLIFCLVFHSAMSFFFLPLPKLFLPMNALRSDWRFFISFVLSSSVSQDRFQRTILFHLYSACLFHVCNKISNNKSLHHNEFFCDVLSAAVVHYSADFSARWTVPHSGRLVFVRSCLSLSITFHNNNFSRFFSSSVRVYRL